VNRTLAAALVTTALAVPAGWRSLGADIQTDGPQMRPKQQTFNFDDGTLVTLDLDRGVMPSGGRASVTLVASSDHAHKVKVSLAAMENMGYGGERVPNPPLEVDSKVVTLDAQPGGGPPLVWTVQLDKKERRLGYHEWFDIIAKPAHHAKDEAIESASVGIATWSGNSFAMSLEPPVALPAEGQFSLAVRIKNTTKKPMRLPRIDIGSSIAGVQDLSSELYLKADGFEVEAVEEPTYDDEARIAPGGEQLTVYRIKPDFGIDHFTFVAHAEAYETGAALATVSVERPKVPDPEPQTKIVTR
jgi:hypothetical protein